MRTAAVLWGPFGRAHLEGAQPDYWLERPEELLTLVRESSDVTLNAVKGAMLEHGPLHCVQGCLLAG